MNFKEGLPIYVQIAERLADEILAGKYAVDSRIPGVREYAVLLEVNLNTVVKSYDLLSSRDVIYNKRGLGYFVSPQAPEVIHAERKTAFLTSDLPEIVRKMQQLGITVDEVADRLRQLASG